MDVLPIYGGHSEYEIVLSEKGLESMKAIPSSLSSDVSFGEMLVDSSKKKAVETVVEVAGKALSYGAGLIVDIS